MSGQWDSTYRNICSFNNVLIHIHSCVSEMINGKHVLFVDATAEASKNCNVSVQIQAYGVFQV